MGRIKLGKCKDIRERFFQRIILIGADSIICAKKKTSFSPNLYLALAQLNSALYLFLFIFLSGTHPVIKEAEDRRLSPFTPLGGQGGSIRSANSSRDLQVLLLQNKNLLLQPLLLQ